jgi:hypothetical protein
MRVTRAVSAPDAGVQGSWILSETFASYAQADLDRWRQIIGHQVRHVDPRWGDGLVETVSWGTCCQHVPAYAQIKIRYDAGWTVIAHSETWHRHHQSVSVPAVVEAAIRQCLDADLSEEERLECLSRHTRELRERRDQETLDRASRMKQVALNKQSKDAASGEAN